MRFSDVQVRHVYNVIFDPVRNCEFNNTHLAVVLKKNNDKRTCIVMPLTSESNGVGVNKIDIGNISTLPNSLKSNTTYAVYNQVRTVNVNRFIALKEVIGGVNTPIQCPMSEEIFDRILQLAILELTYHYNIDDKMKIFEKLYNEQKVNKCLDIAYNIIKANKKIQLKNIKIENNKENSELIKEEILKLQKGTDSLSIELNNLLKNLNYTLSQEHILNGVQEVFENAKGALTNDEKYDRF